MKPEDMTNKEDASNSTSAEPTTSMGSSQDFVDSETSMNKQKRKKILYIVSLIIIGIPILGYIFLVFAFSGGIGGVINGLKPEPNPKSSSIISKRKVAVTSITDSFTELEKNIGFTNYGTSNHDVCYKPHAKWDGNYNFAHRCSYRITKFYGFNGDFRQQMINFEEQIIANDWKPQSGVLPMKKKMDRFYDENYGTGKTPPTLVREGYLVANLSIENYSNEKAVLEINFSHKKSLDFLGVESAQWVTGGTWLTTYDKQDFQDINSIFKKITQDNQDNKYILVISIQEDYFEN